LRASVLVQFLLGVFGRALRLVEADVLSLIQGYCQRPLFPAELLLNPGDMREAGIRVFEKSVSSQEDNGGRDRDRTCDPCHVKVSRVARVADFAALASS
jgi:hypothetical protein